MNRAALASRLRVSPNDASKELLTRLEAVEAASFEHTPSVVIFGDSRAYGSGCSNGSPPTELANATDVAPTGGLVGGWVNLAFEGLLSAIAQPVTRMSLVRNRAVIGSGMAEVPNGLWAASLAIILTGTNDVISGGVTTAQQLFDGIVAAHLRCLDLPFSTVGSAKTLACTIPVATNFTGGKQAIVDGANTLMRNASSPHWSGLLDLDAILTLADMVDGLHFNNAGHVKAANAAVTAINTILNAS